jgi:phosphate transport system permease protein
LVRIASGLFAVALASAMLLGKGGVAAAASGATIRAEPSASSVAGGTNFTVAVVENAGVGTIGAQGTLTFDPTLVQVTDLKAGPDYEKGLSLFSASFDGSADKAKAAADKANQTGTVAFEASGTSPAGDATVVTLTMEAVRGPGGTATFALRAPSMLGQDGNVLPVAGSSGTVTVAVTAGVTAPPRPSGMVSASALPDTAVLTLAPASPQVAIGESVAVEVKISTTSTIVGLIKASLTFDNSLLQVVKVEAGPLVKGVALQAGLTTIAAGIETANSTGKLNEVKFAVPEGVDAQGMDGTVLVVTLKGIADGTSTLDLGAGLETPDGGSIPVVAQPSQLLVGVGGTTPSGTTDEAGATGGGGLLAGADPLFVGLAAILVVLALGDLILFVMPRRARRQRLWFRRWPLAVALVLGIIPVIMFTAIVVIVVINALPAVSDPGLGALLGDKFIYQFSGQGTQGNWTWGLLPALWGSFEITVVAILVALPVSMAMAIVSTEFPMGPVGRVVRPLVGMLSGIPPIVYAVSLLILVHVFMIPKFAADSTYNALKLDPTIIGANPATWPPSGVPFDPGSYPWGTTLVGGNSVLLGGILVALLLVPFMTPMIADAIRNVPTSAREASLALGANRVYTLRRAILPMAVPGMVTAAVLGTLKAVGDIIIVSLAVGWEANTIPNPVFDLLEKTPSLAAQGANMITPFNTPGGGPTVQPAASIGFLTALFFLVAAGAMVLLMNYLKARWRRRLSI